MSTSQHEPTNEELWAQPPHVSSTVSAAPGQQLAPVAATPPSPAVPSASPRDRTSFVLAIVSMAIGIPLTAIGADYGGIAGLVVAWIGIVLVNAVYGATRRR